MCCNLKFPRQDLYGLLHVLLQESYPVVPSAGEVELSFYNGLSSQCDKPKFIMEYSEPGSSTTKSFDIDFSKFTQYPDDSSRDRDYVVTWRFPNTNFTIKPASIKCGQKTIEFSEHNFGSVPEPVTK